MKNLFTRIASKSASAMGHPAAFLGATAACIVWAVSGPLFAYSDTWQLVINTATTVLTFLAVFLIQNSQNRDAIAIQAKLDEILRALGEARSGFVGIENMTEGEIARIKSALEREVIRDLQEDLEKLDDDNPTVDELLAERASEEAGGTLPNG